MNIAVDPVIQAAADFANAMEPLPAKAFDHHASRVLCHGRSASKLIEPVGQLFQLPSSR